MRQIQHKSTLQQELKECYSLHVFFHALYQGQPATTQALTTLENRFSSSKDPANVGTEKPTTKGKCLCEKIKIARKERKEQTHMLIFNPKHLVSATMHTTNI
jgi:hypothetical protein